MFTLVYVSRADPSLKQEDLMLLLQTSRRNNVQNQITGMLLYKDGNFMQLLEGEEPAVRDLYTRIAADQRHYSLTVLLDVPIPERQFPEWYMGFRDLKTVDERDVPGYSKFLDVPLTAVEFADQPSRGQELLLLFKRIG